jgi:putative intracellular protease/amidase
LPFRSGAGKGGAAGGRHLTVYQTPRTLNELEKAGGRYVARDVVIDGNMVTAGSPRNRSS